MPESVRIIESNIQREDGANFVVQLDAEVPDREDGINVTFFIADDSGQRLCDVRYEGKITNPIDLGAIAITAATAYGLCIAGRYAVASATIVYKTYNELPEGQTVREKCYDVIGRLPQKGDEFKGSAKTVLKRCMGSAFFGIMGD